MTLNRYLEVINMRKFFYLLLILMFVVSAIAHAEVNYFTGEGSYILEANDTIEHGKNEALKEALSSVSMQAAAAIKGKYASESNRLTDDVLEMVTASIIKIKDKTFDINIESDNATKIKVAIKAEIDVEEAIKMSQEFLAKNSDMTINKDTTLKQDNLPIQNSAFTGWWENDIIVANGYGIAPENIKNPKQAQNFARRAAIMDGYRRLAETAGGVHITANKTVVHAEINATIVGAKIVSEEFDELGNCTVTLHVPIYGVTDSFASAVLKPTKKEEFLMPSENVDTLGTYTGVIIDCGDLELNPVLTPTIQRIDNQSIYSYNNLDSQQVIAKGMISYKIKEEIKSSGDYLLLGATSSKKNLGRIGNNPLVIKAVALNNDGSCPVIAVSDANRVLSENQVSHFLDKGAVVFTSNRIRGMRM